ncbi:hypothetical protein [Burkholderia sp. Ac-20365]|uniref:hypothetical protein n=1 Tax=Burkholderia sp. Ac-20365 TaxID=2703897 RepID=UPI00197B61C5|nr:hypothetical protein [Burkholderia sp. Ac-20365]MBN3761276.1 hypothetical protein [Burkholderia sp. Ac-20365]
MLMGKKSVITLAAVAMSCFGISAVAMSETADSVSVGQVSVSELVLANTPTGAQCGVAGALGAARDGAVLLCHDGKWERIGHVTIKQTIADARDLQFVAAPICEKGESPFVSIVPGSNSSVSPRQTVDYAMPKEGSGWRLYIRQTADGAAGIDRSAALTATVTTACSA